LKEQLKHQRSKEQEKGTKLTEPQADRPLTCRAEFGCSG